MQAAFQSIADLHFDFRGEKTAAAMENQLSAIERKIDDLLASVDGMDMPELEKESSQSGYSKESPEGKS